MTLSHPHCTNRDYAEHCCRKAMHEALAHAVSIANYNQTLSSKRRLGHKPLVSPLPYLRRAAALAGDLAALRRGELAVS